MGMHSESEIHWQWNRNSRLQSEIHSIGREIGTHGNAV